MNYTDELDVRQIMINALKEDIGAGDITSTSFIPAKKKIKAYILAKEDGVACGLSIAAMCFKLRDKNIKFKPLVTEGAYVKKGQKVAVISGNARGILAAERVALNFLSHLFGVATKTRIFVEAVKPCKVKVLDTRKTTPGLRSIERYAVRIGGGFNHRFNLEEMILIKDNHLSIIGGIGRIAELENRFRSEIEVSSLKELKHALALRPDIIMLDNMKLSHISKAIQVIRSLEGHRPLVEVSGGVNLNNIKQVARLGPDMVSVGSLTHSVRSIDLSLEVL